MRESFPFIYKNKNDLKLKSKLQNTNINELLAAWQLTIKAMHGLD